MNISLVLSLTGLILSMSVLGGLTLVYAQNNTNGTDTTTGGTTTGIASLLGVISTVGVIMGTLGTIIAKLPFTWSKRVSKYAMTYGQKVVDLTADNYHLAMAVNIATEGKLEKNLKTYGKTMDDIKARMIAANEQAKYLDPAKYLPVNPNEDPDMPRERDVKAGGVISQ